MASFAFYYIEANIVCILVFAIMLVHNRFSVDRQEKQIKFDRALAAFILYFLADCFWAAVQSEVIPKTRFSMTTVAFLLYLFMTLIIYFWLDYVMAFEQTPHRNRPINRFAVAFPFLVATLALILQLILAPRTLIDDNLNSTFAFTVYLVAVPYIYMAAILFYTIRQARSAENPGEKRKHLFVGFFPLLTVIGGMVEMFWLPQAPIFCFTSMLLMLVFYIQSIVSQISLDPLTGLNNRGQLEHYCSQRGNLYLPDRRTFAVMMDIDRFKSINDTYGHAEGDRALMMVSGALKKVLSNHSMPSFLCRYGGDEFLLILHPVLPEEVEELISEIREELDRQENTHHLKISAGYAELHGSGDTIQACIQRADKMLYLDKNRRNKTRPQTVAV